MEESAIQYPDESRFFEEVLNKINEIRLSEKDARRKIAEIATTTVDFDNQAEKLTKLIRDCGTFKDTELDNFANHLVYVAEKRAINRQAMTMADIGQLLSSFRKNRHKNYGFKDSMESIKENLFEMMRIGGELQIKLDKAEKEKAELEMKLSEMNKLLASVARKSSEEGVQKALQTFVNYSKRKTADKRAYIKNTVLEFANVNRISIPEELANAIDNLDDEQSEPKTVTVNGNYIEAHDNKDVKVNG